MVQTYFLDANILYSDTLRDCFITLGTRGVPIRWSAGVEAEFIRARARKGAYLAKAARRVVALMRAAIPDYRAIASRRAIEALSLPDPDDRHVLAAAIQAGSAVIVTANLKDFPAAALAPLGIRAISPDEALLELFDEDPARGLESVREMRGRMKNPPLSSVEWLERLEKAGGKGLAARLRAERN